MRVLAFIGLLAGQGLGDMTACAATATGQFAVGIRIAAAPHGVKGSAPRHVREPRPRAEVFGPSTITISY